MNTKHKFKIKLQKPKYQNQYFQTLTLNLHKKLFILYNLRTKEKILIDIMFKNKS